MQIETSGKIVAALSFMAYFHLSVTALDDSDFIPLFNGKDLDGWQQVNCAQETFTARDGMIVCTGKPTGVLRTERQYENFILEIEWRHMKPRGNAGIFVWSEGISAPGVPFARSIEVQVLENEYGETKNYTCHGDIFPIHGSKMIPDNGRGGSRSFPTEKRSNPAGQWNRYVIICVDGTIKLSVNGKFVNGGTQCHYQKGYICLESEGSECHFRNLQIHELPPSGAESSNTAPDAEDWKSLYSGLDLRNWKTDGSSVWKSRDWRLVNESDRVKTRPLESGKKYYTYSVQMDYIWEDEEADPTLVPIMFGQNTNWGFEVIPGSVKSVLSKLQAKKWYRLRIDRGSREQTLWLNGKIIAKDSPIKRERTEGFALRNGGQKIVFASIYAKEN